MLYLFTNFENDSVLPLNIESRVLARGFVCSILDTKAFACRSLRQIEHYSMDMPHSKGKGRANRANVSINCVVETNCQLVWLHVSYPLVL
jgi:hypothetical protein